MTIGEACAIAMALSAILGMAVLMIKLGRMAGAMEATLNSQNSNMRSLKDDLKELGEDFKELGAVVTQLAVTNTRLDSFSAHLVRIDKQVQDLAHGEGFVFPLGAHFPPKTSLG